MRTFIDWAGATMPYRFKLRHNVYEQGDSQWCCFLALGAGADAKEDIEKSPLWSCFGTGDTKAIALRSAIKSWTTYDKEGILP
jgi:hypothetical protein